MSNGSVTPYLDRVSGLVSEFELLPTVDVVVACSGGKDSVFTCLVLRELGYRVLPLMVDMDYSSHWESRVTASLEALGFEPRCVRARYGATPGIVSGHRRQLLLQNVRVVSAGSQDATSTPCTSCYNSKVLLMAEFMEQEGFERIVFGHHATDATSSLLKSALMFVDRWDRGQQTYDPERFHDLVVEFRDSLLEPDSSLLKRVSDLVASNNASTDEPPVQALMAGSPFLIVRPLFTIWEHEIESATAALRGLEASGCGHTFSRTRQTPREIVQHEVLKKVERNVVARESFMSILRQCLRPDGFALADVRRRRAALLGDGYKPKPGGIDKL